MTARRPHGPRDHDAADRDDGRGVDDRDEPGTPSTATPWSDRSPGGSGDGSGPGRGRAPGSGGGAGDDAARGDEPERHLGSRISALLDGELDIADELEARRHLAGCDHCQDEFAETTAARTLVRDLPDPDLPPGFLDQILDHGRASSRRRSLGLFGLVGLALVWVLSLLFVVRLALPEVAAPVMSTIGVAEVLADGRSPALPLEPDALDAPYVAPETLDGGWERVGVWSLPGTDRDGVVTSYEREGAQVVIGQLEGRLDQTSLPTELVAQPDASYVAGIVEGVSVAVVERDSMVWVVATDDFARLAEVVSVLPPGQPYPIADRISNNFDDLLDRLG